MSGTEPKKLRSGISLSTRSCVRTKKFLQIPPFGRIINRCVPVRQDKSLPTRPCVYTCVPYELQKPLESGMAVGKGKASFRKEAPQCAHWGGGLRFAEQNIRSKMVFCKLVCFAHFACGEIQSSVSLRLKAPFQRSFTLRGTVEPPREPFGQTRVCGFDRKERRGPTCTGLGGTSAI